MIGIQVIGRGRKVLLHGLEMQIRWLPFAIPLVTGCEPYRRYLEHLKATGSSWSVWHTIEEYKAVQDERNKITIKEIRARISEMPWRCQQLVKTGEAPIKAAL